MGPMTDNGTMMGWPWPGIVGLVVVLVVLCVIVTLTWVLVGRARRPVEGPPGQPPAPNADPALATLRDRFARGEIDETEYTERQRALER